MGNVAIPGGGECSFCSWLSSSSIVTQVGWLAFSGVDDMLLAISSVFLLEAVDAGESATVAVVVVLGGVDRGTKFITDGLTDAMLRAEVGLVTETTLSDEVGLTTVVNILLPYGVSGDLVIP